MSIQSLRGFQEEVVGSGVALFDAARRLLDAAGSSAADRATVVNHNGYLLIEAATGSGKTLMAGSIVERFTRTEDVVWFWFAPFKGVVGQSAAFLREQFHGLRLRELADDRVAAGSRRGDVFVTTWQTVATRVKDKRNVRKEGETSPSVDALIESLHGQGLRIGVVVDEAHHGFGKETLAAKFFREVLKPEYTILITATPDDADVKDFEKAMEIAELQRIRVSRTDAVDAGLIKSGVKCAAYFVEPEKRSLVDLQGTALRDGVAAHRALKTLLADIKVPLVPLMLVQADSTDKSVEILRGKLLRLGFTEEQIAVHTADEPDAGLLALANDERREVLIFKMAVALGFDAPRAFTLVSMRASRDEDFGTQLLGRILRVHRLLHGRARAKSLPGLNTWERPFADLLDRDGTGIVTWWHRNEPHKPWSVNVLMPDGRGFFPDFLIGVEGRKTEGGVLLADPKLNYQRDDEASKVLAEHRLYGRVLILFRDGGTRWMTVGYDDKTRKPFLAREFRLSDAVGF